MNSIFNTNNNSRINNNVDSTPLPVMLTVKETAKTFGIAQHFARQLALSGKVYAVRAGSKILINAQSVSDYFNNSKLTDSEESKTEGKLKGGNEND